MLAQQNCRTLVCATIAFVVGCALFAALLTASYNEDRHLVPATNADLVNIVFLDIQEGKMPYFITKFNAYVTNEVLRNEEGVLQYELTTSKDPNQLLLVERYKSIEATILHVSAPAFSEFWNAMKNENVLVGNSQHQFFGGVHAGLARVT